MILYIHNLRRFIQMGNDASVEKSSVTEKPNALTLYVLRLENDKYYVGTTINIDQRINQHKNGGASAWTDKHKFLELIMTKPIESSLEEDLEVKKLMDVYGIDNVRGGCYSQIILPPVQIDLLRRELNHAAGKCLGCGEKGHFVKDCPNKLKTLPAFPPVIQCSRCHEEGHNIRDCRNSTRADGQLLCGAVWHKDIKCWGLACKTTGLCTLHTPTETDCIRCSRSTHSIEKCYATTDTYGNLLCPAITQKGTRCRHKVNPGYKLCRQHNR